MQLHPLYTQSVANNNHEDREMSPSTLTRIAPPKTEGRAARDKREKQERDRAFEAGVRWFLAVSRLALTA